MPHGNLVRAREVRQLTLDAGLTVAAYGSYYKVNKSETDGLRFATVLETAVAVTLLPGDTANMAKAVVFNDVIVPMQSALGALLAVFLALAAFRMLRRRRTFGSFCFLLSALVVLITQVPIDIPALTTVRQFVDAFTTGGLRGLLLGVAIGIVATAFRVLLFIDRPQSE